MLVLVSNAVVFQTNIQGPVGCSGGAPPGKLPEAKAEQLRFIKKQPCY